MELSNNIYAWLGSGWSGAGRGMLLKPLAFSPKPLFLMLTLCVALLWTIGWGKDAEFAGAPNLILNPGFESDAQGAIVGEGQETRFSAKGDGVPDEWECRNAVIDSRIAHSGKASVLLSAPGGSLTSTNGVITGGPVLLSAWSRAENVPEGSTYRLSCSIGAKAYTLDFTPGTHDWEQKSLVVTPEEDFAPPRVSITFQAPEGSVAKVWFDDIYLGQPQPYPNLAVNPGFESGSTPLTTRGRPGEMPRGWGKLPADYLPYWGGYYWPAMKDETMSHRGKASLRCDAAAGQTGGAAQTISLKQKEPRPIIVGVHSRAENLIADNFCWLAVETWYENGKRELETARTFLGKASHDWDYRTFTIMPKQPVDHIVVKVENKSSLRTATVWVDDLYVAEVGTSPAELRGRGLTLPAIIECAPLESGFGVSKPETRNPSNKKTDPPFRWADSKLILDGRIDDECWEAVAPVYVGTSRAALTYDKENLYIAVSGEAERVEVMLSPFGIPDYDDIDHISFYRFAVSRDGTASAEAAIDQDGYVFYLPADLGPQGWEAKAALPLRATHASPLQPETQNSKLTQWTAEMRIPFAALGMNPPSPAEEWLVNLASQEEQSRVAWAAENDNFRNFGRLRFCGRRELELSGISFGEGLPDGLDMSETWITKSDVRWGENIFRGRLTNHSSSLKTLTVGAYSNTPLPGPSPANTVTASLAAGKTWDLGLPYQTTSSGRQQLRLTVKDADSKETIVNTTYPINVPDPIQLHQGQFYYYPDEGRALFDIACPYLPSENSPSLRLRLIREATGETLVENIFPAERRLTCGTDISALPISSEPVRDYRCQVELVQDGTTLASASTTFGRLERPKFPPLPPVQSVSIGTEGALLVNGKPFFPIIASLRGGGPYARASEMGFNSEKDNIGEVEGGKARIDEAWSRNVYMVVSDYQSVPQDREAIARFASTHPGVLMHVGSEVTYDAYFTEAGRESFRYRQSLDPKHPMFWEFQGGSGSWYARALGVPALGDVVQPTNAIVTDGPLGRTAPRGFDLERAAATHPQMMQVVVVPIRDNRGEFLVPGGWHQYMRSFPWQSYEILRAGVYLAVIHGARGLYYYDPGRANEIDGARGLVLELRVLSPILFSPSVPRTASISPARNHIDVLQKEYEGKTYLITCNRSEDPQQVEFLLPNLTADTSILRRFEPSRPIERTADGKGFSDSFEGYEVHIYEIG